MLSAKCSQKIKHVDKLRFIIFPISVHRPAHTNVLGWIASRSAASNSRLAQLWMIQKGVTRAYLEPLSLPKKALSRFFFFLSLVVGLSLPFAA